MVNQITTKSKRFSLGPFFLSQAAIDFKNFKNISDWVRQHAFSGACIREKK